jgi:arylsulfatase A-like enzyme
MQWPGVVPAGSTYRHPVMTFDLSATALAAAQADASQVDGKDLLSYVTGKLQAPPHDTLFWRSRTMSNNYGARQGDWKFVHSTEGDASPGPKQTALRDLEWENEREFGEKLG